VISLGEHAAQLCGHHLARVACLVDIDPFMQTNPSEPAPVHGRTAVLLHWLLALALFMQLALGWWMLDIPKDPPGVRASWFNLHKSIGLTLAALVVFRLAWQATHVIAEAAHLSRWQVLAARLNHGSLYLCMLVMPLSGYLGSSFSGYPVRFFGVMLPGWAPVWPAAKQAMSALHLASVWLFMALLVLHIGAAFWHLLRRDEVCARMGLPLLGGGGS
jgi:cytochrome b561